MSDPSRIAGRLREGLDAVLGDRYRPDGSTKVDLYRDGLVVRSHDLTERCPRRAGRPPDDYQERVLTARRRVGLLVLRQLWSSGPTASAVEPAHLPAAVRAVFARPDDWPPRLWSWASSLEPAGRAALAAAVLTWCDGVMRVAGTSPDITWCDPALPVRRDVPGRAVGLAATVDATRRADDGERVLVVAGAASALERRVLAGHAALVRSAEGRRDRVTRVTVASPATGRRDHVVVDDALVELAVDRVVEHVAFRVAPDRAPTRPSAACSHCHLLDDCSDGRAHLTHEPARRTLRAGPGTPGAGSARRQGPSGAGPTT